MLSYNFKERSLYFCFFILLSIILGSIMGVLINDQRKQECFYHSNLENIKSCIADIDSDTFPFMIQGAILGFAFCIIISITFWIITGKREKS